jgi:hypothetical protein
VGLRYFARTGAALAWAHDRVPGLELYASKADCATVAAGLARLHRAAAELVDERRPVRFVRSIFVPEDETCFLLVDATSAEDVRETARRASLEYERVVEATADLTNERSTAR